MASEKLSAPYESLSKRSVEILGLLAEGMSDREIAQRLVMTINTIKWYNRQIYSVLGVGSRTQAIARARELHLLNKNHEDVAYPDAGNPIPRQNLPVETTHFISRQSEMAMLRELLDTSRLLTLVGPPGMGKTRLALQLARESLADFVDGVYFVSLASVTAPEMVMNVIASTIGLSETPHQALAETLKQAFHNRPVLLILDNFEHLLTAAAQVSELLAAAPHLKVLATSREALHLYGEQEYSVPPLALPDPENLDPHTLAECESVALFIQQAQALRADFELTAENASDIARICIRLEGLPLAIELAAARLKLLTPRNLLVRLVSRLDTLTTGAHDLPARHQTLHNAIEWSYNLLNEGEKMLLARLAVFQGDYSLETIEAVCGRGLPINLFDGLESLLNKNLIQQKYLPDGDSRFFMLDTLQEYAWERLILSGETPMMRQWHIEYCAEIAEVEGYQERHRWFHTHENIHENSRAVLSDRLMLEM